MTDIDRCRAVIAALELNKSTARGNRYVHVHVDTLSDALDLLRRYGPVGGRGYCDGCVRCGSCAITTGSDECRKARWRIE